ncbi:MAG TPA: tRNA pseudouridine(38-40) synthase TruA [Pirellulales bacterium]|jgi:tRNA pseudouridine38-40 synthase|nr:tRNA pseudouridine(38-40) synthase TruA [Pirellulales bacterium]
MRTFKLVLAYDGTNYSGWQAQQGHVTLQGTLEAALARITGESLRVAGSGRTDAGVHAEGQVVSFRSETRLAPDVLQRALNAELPRDMAVLEASHAADDFHARRSARSKRYRYQLEDGPVRGVFARPYVWHYRAPLDEAAMHRAAQTLLGTHDFSSFETSGSPRESSVRTVFYIGVKRGQGRGAGRLDLEIEADGFLYNMVRSIVGTLVEVGRGERDEAWPAQVLAARDRKQAGQTAPPQGLFLVRVNY